MLEVGGREVGREVGHVCSLNPSTLTCSTRESVPCICRCPGADVGPVLVRRSQITGELLCSSQTKEKQSKIRSRHVRRLQNMQQNCGVEVRTMSMSQSGCA